MSNHQLYPMRMVTQYINCLRIVSAVKSYAPWVSGFPPNRNLKEGLVTRVRVMKAAMIMLIQSSWMVVRTKVGALVMEQTTQAGIVAIVEGAGWCIVLGSNDPNTIPVSNWTLSISFCCMFPSRLYILDLVVFVCSIVFWLCLPVIFWYMFYLSHLSLSLCFSHMQLCFHLFTFLGLRSFPSTLVYCLLAYVSQFLPLTHSTLFRH